ncbi:uroporphyrinogen-III C-methyltransferase [Rheinheimera marina]|uniref:uroporphyrinogen-III C-methyltransferase n=1 Tax=Rheinheimera marina TaxID=1774958 RepID=A0ABV9JIJ4_9GAMM
MSLLSYLRQRPWPGLNGFFDLSAFKNQSSAATHGAAPGVYLIGTGPGDPELITVKADRLLRQADVVLYDALIPAQLLSLLPRRCQRIYVGKRAGQHALKQTEINKLLVEYGRSGGVVLRLKGGDPAIFGRVAEEAQALEQAGLPFAIIPGITSASAASAYSGIPLTSRGVACSVRYLTAQFADQAQSPDWAGYRYLAAGQNPTLVVYMGLGRLGELCRGLRSVGWPADTAIALLDKVSTAEQQQLTGSLADIEQRLQKNPLHGPTLIVVGEVVKQPMAVSAALLSCPPEQT